MTTYLRTPCRPLFALLLLLVAGRLPGQPTPPPGTFSATDTLKFMAVAHKALDSYQARLNEVVVYPQAPGEVQSYKDVILNDYYFRRTIPVYNAINRETYTGAEYVTQFYNQRLEMTLDLNRATYRFTQLPDKGLVLIAFVEQQLTHGKKPALQTARERLAIHLTFSVFVGNNGYEPQDYRIVRVEKAPAGGVSGRALPAGLDIDSLRSRNRDLSWVARRLARSIREQLPTGTQTLYLEKFVYSNSQMTGDFSDELMALLRHRLKTDETIGTDAGAGNTGVGVRGRYIERGNQVEITTELFNRASQKALATLRPNTDLPVSWVYTKGLKLKPDGSEQATETQQVLTSSAALPTASPAAQADKLTISLGTSLKSRNNEFWEADTMHVSVRLNKPGFVRLLYIDAQGTPTLLWREYEIKPGRENTDVPFPEPFVCVPPFGRETLVAVASTSPFCPVATTRNDYGVDIVSGTLADALRNTRCVESRGLARAPQTAEARQSFTTRRSK